MNDESNNTVSILTSYAFPKLSQYYSSKGKTCIIEQYQNQITQYFINNQLNIQKFYTSSIKKNDFITNIIKFIDNQNGTTNADNYQLQTAIKRLYTILQLHKHAISSERSISEINNISTTITPTKKNETEIKKRERNRMDMVHQLSAAHSELSSLQQTVNSLKYITDETQKKLAETEKKEETYKQTVNELQNELNTEKTQVNEIITVNKELQNELRHKMNELERNKEMSAKLNNTNLELQNQLNFNTQQMLSVNEQLEKQNEYKKMINDLQRELQTKQEEINKIDAITLWKQQLQIGSKLDCLNCENIWCNAEIINIDANGYRIRIRYDGFNNNNKSKCDEWINIGSTRIVPYMTKVKINNCKLINNINYNLKPVAKAKYKNGKITSIYKQGFLVKQGKRFKNYKTRYFRLFEDGKIDYFKTMTSKVAIGTFNVFDMIEIRKIEYPKNKHLHGFEIVTNKRTWRFQADSNQIVDDWINVIQSIVAGVNVNDNQSPHSIKTTGKQYLNDDMKELNICDIKQGENILYNGWMYKQGKWDTNWTYRYCILNKNPICLKCFVGINKKQTHCIEFKNVKTCIELDKNNSDKFAKLEIPTMFAFHLVTVSRMYTFACKSKLDINIWLKTFRSLNVIDVVGMDKQLMKNNKLIRRSSIVKFGSSLNKLSTSFGRLIGVTSEHVTATQVFEKNNNNNNNNNNINVAFERRKSLPALSNWTKMQNENNNNNSNNIVYSRRKSAPVLPGFELNNNQMENDIKKGIIIEENENVNNINQIKEKEIMNNINDDFVNESEISDLDEYD